MSITGTFNESGHGVVTALATYGVTVNSVTNYNLLVGLSQSPATVELVDTSTMTGIDSWTGTGQKVDTLGLYSSSPSFGAVAAERGSPAKLEQINRNVSTAMISPQSFSAYYVPFGGYPKYYSMAQAEALSSSTNFGTTSDSNPYTMRNISLASAQALRCTEDRSFITHHRSQGMLFLMPLSHFTGAMITVPVFHFMQACLMGQPLQIRQLLPIGVR